jgi:hypothetical protein
MTAPDDQQLHLKGLARPTGTTSELAELRSRLESGPAPHAAHPRCGAMARQRAEAALRLPALEDGSRDPDIPWTLAPPARGEMVLEVGDRFTAWLQGNVRRVVPLLDAVGCPRQWDAEAGAWSLPRARVDDVLARADLEKRRIRLRQVDR